MNRARAQIVLILFFALLAASCVGQKQETIPPAPPPSPTPASVPAPTPASAPTPPATKAPTPKIPPRSAPVIHEPKPTPKPLEPETPMVLAPSITDVRKDKIENEVTTKIRRTEQLVATVDSRHLSSQESETFTAIQSFLSKAKEALHEKDMPRALNLVDKAQALAQDLPTNPGK